MTQSTLCQESEGRTPAPTFPFNLRWLLSRVKTDMPFAARSYEQNTEEAEGCRSQVPWTPCRFMGWLVKGSLRLLMVTSLPFLRETLDIGETLPLCPLSPWMIYSEMV